MLRTRLPTRARPTSPPTDPASGSAAPPSAPPSITADPVSGLTGENGYMAVSEDAIQFAKHCLASEVGPIAGMLVRKAAKRASDHADFVRRLAEELSDPERRDQFLRQMKSHL